MTTVTPGYTQSLVCCSTWVRLEFNARFVQAISAYCTRICAYWPRPHCYSIPLENIWVNLDNERKCAQSNCYLLHLERGRAWACTGHEVYANVKFATKFCAFAASLPKCRRNNNTRQTRIGLNPRWRYSCTQYLVFNTCYNIVSRSKYNLIQLWIGLVNPWVNFEGVEVGASYENWCWPSAECLACITRTNGGERNS